MAQSAGRDPQGLQIAVRANAEITDTGMGEAQRQMLNGSIDQIVKDLRWMRDLQVDHVFFDMNGIRTPIDDKLRSMEQMNKSLNSG